MTTITFRLKGGSGSGNFGHQGRPGEVGGSSGGGRSSTLGPKPYTTESQEEFDEWAGQRLGDAWNRDVHGSYSRRITNQKDGRYVEVTLSRDGRKAFMHAYVEMRDSGNRRIAGTGATFFKPTALIAAMSLFESGKFPSKASVRNFGS